MEKHVPKSVLVTGGCGFIASNFISFVSSDWKETKIVNFDKMTLCSDACNVDPDVRSSDRYFLIMGDLSNQKLVEKTLQDFQIDTIVNFAANSHVDDCYKDPLGSTKNNVLGMTHLLEACRQYGQLTRFVHISSDEVYGDSGCGPGEKPKEEDSRLSPTNTYAATKASCEALLNAYRISYHIPAIILRMNNVYGPRQWDSKVVPHFIKIARRGDAYTIMGDGQQLRSWMYVDDASNGIRLITEKGRIGEVYNLGTHFELCIYDLAKAIHSEVSSQLGTSFPFKITKVPDRPYNDRRYYIDTQKITEEIGWKCRVPFAEGLKCTVDWYLNPNSVSMTEKVLVYGGKGWIGQQFSKLLQEHGISFVHGRTRPGHQKDQQVEDELIGVAPTHVISFIGRTHGPGCNTIEYLEGGPDKLRENVRDNLHGPWVLASLCQRLGIHMTYMGTGCIYRYDSDHRIGGVGYKEDDEPNYFGNSYSVIKGHIDRMMRHFDNVLNARIRLPVNFELDNRNLVVKVASYKEIYDIPDSITILPDILPIVLDLMKKRYTGTLNMTNPEPISHSETLAMYRKLVDPSKNWELIRDDSLEAERMRSSRAHCCLDTTKLLSMYPNLRTGKDGVHQAILEIGRKMEELKSARG